METIGADLRQMQRTPLSASHVQALREAGKIITHPSGTFLANPGEPVDRFVYIEEGEIEIVDPYTDKRLLPFTLGPTQFMGEIAFLNGGRLVDAHARGSGNAGHRGAAYDNAEADV